MPKQETFLSREWIKNLTKATTNHSERIKLVNIHGENFQPSGISDWIGCWRGRFVAIEFKIHPAEPTSRQKYFLIDIIECGGIAMIVEFHKRPAITKMQEDTSEYWNKDGFYIEGQEFLTLVKAENNRKDLIYKFIY